MHFRNSGELRLYNGGTSTANMITEVRDASADLTNNNKIAIKYGTSTSDFKVWINGVEKTVACSSGKHLYEIKFTYVSNGGSRWYGKC